MATVATRSDWLEQGDVTPEITTTGAIDGYSLRVPNTVLSGGEPHYLLTLKQEILDFWPDEEIELVATVKLDFGGSDGGYFVAIIRSDMGDPPFSGPVESGYLVQFIQNISGSPTLVVGYLDTGGLQTQYSATWPSNELRFRMRSDDSTGTPQITVETWNGEFFDPLIQFEDASQAGMLGLLGGVGFLFAAFNVNASAGIFLDQISIDNIGVTDLPAAALPFLDGFEHPTWE